MGRYGRNTLGLPVRWHRLVEYHHANIHRYKLRCDPNKPRCVPDEGNGIRRAFLYCRRWIVPTGSLRSPDAVLLYCNGEDSRSRHRRHVLFVRKRLVVTANQKMGGFESRATGFRPVLHSRSRNSRRLRTRRRPSWWVVVCCCCSRARERRRCMWSVSTAYALKCTYGIQYYDPCTQTLSHPLVPASSTVRPLAVSASRCVPLSLSLTTRKGGCPGHRTQFRCLLPKLEKLNES